jgi:hypothetical protein
MAGKGIGGDGDIAGYALPILKAFRTFLANQGRSGEAAA